MKSKKKEVIHANIGSPMTDVFDPSIVKTRLQKYEDAIEKLKLPLRTLLVETAKYSARNPYKVVIFVIALSFGMVTLGFFTNFYLETSNSILWSPSESITSAHGFWVNSPELSGFPSNDRQIVAIIHAKGDDVLHLDGMNRVFDVMDTVRNMEGYSDICMEDKNGFRRQKCEILSPTGFFPNHDRNSYEAKIKTEKDLKKTLSKFRFANGNFVNRALVVGDSAPALTVNDFQVFMVRESLGGISAEDAFDQDLQNEVLEKAADTFELESAKSFLIAWSLPNTGPEKELAIKFEKKAAEELLAMNQKWDEDGDDYVLSLTTRSANTQELVRGIIEDIPLMMGAFLIMTVFTMYSLSKYHRIKSQTSLGIGAVFSVFLAVITGYGLMFCIGIPLTSLTYLFPYAMLGFGLDDTFIITGAFQRTDPTKNVVERIETTIHEIGMSIAVSTLTTVVAYCLGSSSAMPGVRWFCLYASPVIIIAFIYQMTFFVALIALDDKRQRANRLDFFFCRISTKTDKAESTTEKEKRTCSDAIVSNYATFLLKPFTKILVLILFTVMLGIGSWYASGLESALDGRDLLPANSYVLTYFLDLDEYGGGGAVNFQVVGVYFRDMDFSDPFTQAQMHKYINDLVTLPYISSPPLTFWLRDFTLWRRGNPYAQELDFNSQVDLFLKIDQYKDLYSNHIVRDENGFITASRTFVSFDEVDPYNVVEQTNAFQAQRRTTIQQAINNGSADGQMFTFGGIYYAWELWNTLPKEVMMTIILGLASVFILCLIFVSHPIGAFILTPTVAATFIEILAVLRLAGLYMNALTAVGLITCLGLVVDYAIHICLAYFEIQDAKDRNERVHRVITTMGKSIMKGGFTTFLGVLPLSLNSSLGFKTLFITFIGITTLVSTSRTIMSIRSLQQHLILQTSSFEFSHEIMLCREFHTV